MTINKHVYHTPAEAGFFPLPQYTQPPKLPPEMTIDGTMYHTSALVHSLCENSPNEDMDKPPHEITYHTPAAVGVWFYIITTHPPKQYHMPAQAGVVVQQTEGLSILSSLSVGFSDAGVKFLFTNEKPLEVGKTGIEVGVLCSLRILHPLSAL
ncbi:hypothetical protein BS47DRAFT_1369113 [Hydnum rufescens UP504]|uniref:Uncharacterized protein n=1 Tax=Hydnum rufescens UP504 TaxID=1448309 RepID=A0A9P6AF33_9AGAM|nr:hypothetical protein BS47DRAFT_1369113 [Hydnum rufescens UP504]